MADKEERIEKLSDVSSIFEDELPPFRGDDTTDSRQILNQTRFRVLSQLMDKTFGRSSTIKSPKYAVTFKQVGDNRILCKYNSVVMFGCERTNFLFGRGAGIVDKFFYADVVEAEKKYTDVALAHVKEELETLSEQYKKVVGSTKGLTFKTVNYNTSMQLMPTGIHNPRKTSFFYLDMIVEF